MDDSRRSVGVKSSVIRYRVDRSHVKPVGRCRNVCQREFSTPIEKFQILSLPSLVATLFHLAIRQFRQPPMPTATHQQHHNVLKFVFGGEIFTKIVAQFDLFVMQRRIDYTMVVAVCVCAFVAQHNFMSSQKGETTRNATTTNNYSVCRYVNEQDRLRWTHPRSSRTRKGGSGLCVRVVDKTSECADVQRAPMIYAS